jgi:hypothetical protein
MSIAVPISKKLFDIFLLFTRDPFVRYFTKELEFYSNGNGGLIGLVSLDLTDNDYSVCILSRDESRQYRAETIKVSIPTIEEARNWIEKKMGDNSIVFHDNQSQFFDIFGDLNNKNKLHPNYVLLRDHAGFKSAKSVLKEISYHYKDIDGNFIDQFQSLNGFDARIWELYLFCFFREQYFHFERNYEAPDFIVEKLTHKIAVEAVIVGRKTPLSIDHNYKTQAEIDDILKNEMPLMFGSALFDKLKKRYWEKPHVKDIPFAIAIADFHDTLSMTWSYNALLEYLYGYKYEHSFDDRGQLIVKPIKIDSYKKPSGKEIPSGFFFQPDSENVSAVVFTSNGTISKFNRIGKQAGFGDKNNKLIRMASFYDHTPHADKPKLVSYEVDESCNETWSEGIVIFHNPNAKLPIDPNLFEESVAQCFFKDGFVHSVMPETFPYNSFTQNIVFTK